MKKIFLVLLMVLSTCSLFAADEYVCDFDGDKQSTDNDLMIMVSYFQVRLLAEKKWATLDLATVQQKARILLNNQSLLVTRLPAAGDVLEDSSRTDLNDNDLMLLVAYFQTRLLASRKLAVLDFASVQDKAGLLLNQTVWISKFPEITLGSVDVPFTMTGIQVGP